MAPLDALTFSIKPVISGTATLNRTGSDYQPNKSPININKPEIAVSKTLANNVSGGGDTLLSAIYTVPAGSSITIDLSSFTDYMQRTGGSFARFKAIEFRLLSVADDATNGTACSGVTIGNHATTPSPLFLGAGTHTIKLDNGAFVAWGTPKAAGVVVGTAVNVKINNDDGAVQARVQVTMAGGST